MPISIKAASLIALCFPLSISYADAALSHLASELIPAKAKNWQLRLGHDVVTVKILTPPAATGRWIALSIEPEGEAKLLSNEESQLISQAINGISAAGYQPQILSRISIPLQNTSYQEGIETAVEKSGTWKNCADRKYCRAAEPVADLYLKTADPFKAFNSILYAYGLKIKSVRVDDMWAGKVSGKVECSGLLIISLARL